jgi:outer membrane protein assembly factor BamD (BamD/ComL family)
LFHRFDVLWTPTVLIMDPNGIERARIEGYLPRTEFRAQLELALGRVAFMGKHWADAIQRYSGVVGNYSNTFASPEALYWRGVSVYKLKNDHTVLAPVAKELKERYPHSLAALKASVWADE